MCILVPCSFTTCPGLLLAQGLHNLQNTVLQCFSLVEPLLVSTNQICCVNRVEVERRGLNKKKILWANWFLQCGKSNYKHVKRGKDTRTPFVGYQRVIFLTFAEKNIRFATIPRNRRKIRIPEAAIPRTRKPRIRTLEGTAPRENR